MIFSRSNVKSLYPHPVTLYSERFFLAMAAFANKVGWSASSRRDQAALKRHIKGLLEEEPSLGKAVVHYQLLAGLSNLEVIATAGVSKTYYSAVRKGRYEPSAKIVSKIAKALGVSPTLVVARSEEFTCDPMKRELEILEIETLVLKNLKDLNI